MRNIDKNRIYFTRLGREFIDIRGKFFLNCKLLCKINYDLIKIFYRKLLK